MAILIFKCSISSPADLAVLRWGYKHVREIARRMKFYRGDFQVGHPSFAEGSQAVTHPAGAPAEISAPKIVYSKEDDDAIDEFHRRTGSSYNVNFHFELTLIFVAVNSKLVGILYANQVYLNHHFIYLLLIFIDLFQIGTCAMKPRERGGVVEERLNVYDVQNLKISGNFLPILLEKFVKNLILSVQTAVSHQVM